MARIRAVLFDIDGTLLDSNDAHAHAWLDALRGHGRHTPFELVRSKIGMHGDKLLAEIGVDHMSTEGVSIKARRLSILKAHYLADLGPFHGARVLVDRLRSRGLVCAAISEAHGDDAAELLRVAGIADLIDIVVSGDHVRANESLVEVALQRISVTAPEALVIADTPYDIQAATQANVSVVALRCGGWSDRDLAGAIAVYDDPSDLSAQLDRSPLALDRDSDPPPLYEGPRRVAV